VPQHALPTVVATLYQVYTTTSHTPPLLLRYGNSTTRLGLGRRRWCRPPGASGGRSYPRPSRKASGFLGTTSDKVELAAAIRHGVSVVPRSYPRPSRKASDFLGTSDKVELAAIRHAVWSITNLCSTAILGSLADAVRKRNVPST
jgi:hypothetical protein